MSQTQTIDPTKLLTIKAVCERTGLNLRTIHRLLARDVEAKTPGRNFAAPVRLPGVNKLYWREATLIGWLEKREEQAQ